MQKYYYKVFDIDEVKMPEEDFINKMAKDGWELFFINNEPVDRTSILLVKLYFRKEVT